MPAPKRVRADWTFNTDNPPPVPSEVQQAQWAASNEARKWLNNWQPNNPTPVPWTFGPFSYTPSNMSRPQGGAPSVPGVSYTPPGQQTTQRAKQPMGPVEGLMATFSGIPEWLNSTFGTSIPAFQSMAGPMLPTIMQSPVMPNLGGPTAASFTAPVGPATWSEYAENSSGGTPPSWAPGAPVMPGVTNPSEVTNPAKVAAGEGTLFSGGQPKAGSGVQAGTAAPVATTYDGLAQQLASSGRLNLNWWNDFKNRHKGPNGELIDPIEYYLAGGVYQTPADALNAAMEDADWGAKFQSTYGRPPSDDDWRYHWFVSHGLNPNNPQGTGSMPVPTMTPTQRFGQWPSGEGQSYASPGAINRNFPPPPTF